MKATLNGYLSVLVGSISSIDGEMGGNLYEYAPRNSVTRGISHHFLFNRCIAIDRLGNVLLVGCLLLFTTTSSLCWNINAVLLDEVVLIFPVGVFKKKY